MRIAMLGTGDVGRALGSGLVARGHEVRIGTRDPKGEKVRAWVKANGAKASAGSFAEAARFGELAVLATLWGGTQSALELSGAQNLAGKVVIDATNPLAPQPKGPPALALGHTDSGGEQVQRWLPGARVVKAFNTVGNAHMVDPKFPGGPPDMFICGNDEAAKRTVSALCAELGWPTIDCGGIEAARLLEPLCILWVSYGIRSGTWNHAFKLLRR
jgi:hypothetical protein